MSTQSKTLSLKISTTQFISGTCTELNDGSIHMQGTTASAENPNGRWLSDVMLEPGMDCRGLCYKIGLLLILFVPITLITKFVVI